MAAALIKTGFRKCGIFPLNRSAGDTSRLSGHSSNPPPPPTSSNQPPPPTSSNQPPPPTSSNPPPPPTSSNPPPPPASSNPPLPPTSSNPNQTSSTSLIGDTSQQEINKSVIGDTSQQEVSNATSSIGDTSQQVNNACSSTPEHSVTSNPLVLPGIVPASLMESFIFPDINVKGKKTSRVNTRARLITSDEHVQAYNDKIQQTRLDQEAKENRRKELERKRLERQQRGKVKTRGGFKRRGLNTRGGKINVDPAKIPRSTRTTKRPMRFMDDSDSEVSSDESTEEEDWTCQEYLNDNGIAADYVGCVTCERWFHKNCARKSELDVFSCKFCLEN